MRIKDKIISVVTGANGFVGSHLVDFLLQKGHEVHCIVRASSNLQWLEGKDIVLHKCGLLDVELLKPILEKSHYIYHIAGVVKSLAPQGYFDGNVLPTRNILNAALSALHVQRVLVVSSMAATGPAPKKGEVTEESPLKPMEPYGYSKVEQEKVVLSFADRLPITIIRPPGIYGERDTEIFAFFKAVNKGIRVRMGFDNKELSLVYVKDLVEGMYQAATHKKTKGETYFLGSSQPYDWKYLGKTTAKLLKKKTIPLPIPHFIIFLVGGIGQLLEKWFGANVDLNWDRAKRVTRPSWYCSSVKAMQDFDYTPDTSIEDGFQKTIDWYKKEEWL